MKWQMYKTKIYALLIRYLKPRACCFAPSQMRAWTLATSISLSQAQKGNLDLGEVLLCRLGPCHLCPCGFIFQLLQMTNEWLWRFDIHKPRWFWKKKSFDLIADSQLCFDFRGLRFDWLAGNQVPVVLVSICGNDFELTLKCAVVPRTLPIQFQFACSFPQSPSKQIVRCVLPLSRYAATDMGRHWRSATKPAGFCWGTHTRFAN